MIAEMQEYYRKRAAFYDQSKGYDQPAIVSTQQPVIDFISDFLAGKNVLELACGPGFWTQQLAKTAASILATDFNEPALLEAKKKSMNPSQVTLLAADAYALPLASNTFNAGLGVDWFCHVPIGKISRFIQELHRVLGPTARVIFCDQLPKDDSFSGRYDEEGNHLQERILPDGSKHLIIKHFFDEAEIKRIFAPHASELRVLNFPSARRSLVAYAVK
jgi:ubiquinone/menaquinone biosynthesis C-methylase UbiE